MSVGKDKTGVLVNMDKELKVKLEQLAKKDGRSLTNLINKILSDYVENTQKQKSVLFFCFYVAFLSTLATRVHNNVNVGDKFLTGITNRYTRQSTDYSLQYKEFHFIPPALVVVEISTHLVRFPL